jgi:hypothetical protein
MTYTTPCPRCAQTLRFLPELRGKSLRCPACATPVTFPPPLPVAEERQAVRAAPLAAPRTVVPTPRPRHERPDLPEPEPFELNFRGVVRHDPQGLLRGTFRARLTHNGLRLRQGDEGVLVVPGAGAEYRRDNHLAVEVDGRRVELALSRPAWQVVRLARDAAAFLNGDLASLDPADYPVPWWLLAPALLPLGIPILTQGGAVWGALGGGLAGLCFSLATLERLSPAVRVAACLGAAAAGYLALFTLHPFLSLW